MTGSRLSEVRKDRTLTSLELEHFRYRLRDYKSRLLFPQKRETKRRQANAKPLKSDFIKNYYSSWKILFIKVVFSSRHIFVINSLSKRRTMQYYRYIKVCTDLIFRAYSKTYFSEIQKSRTLTPT